jgi:CRISPR-associated protein Csm4
MKQIIFIPGFKDKYHFGVKDWTNSRIYCSSHTLFSAIVNNYVSVFGSSNIDKLKEIRISGAFPCLLDENNNPFIKFIPKPLCRLNINEEYSKKHSKKLKKIEFISIEFLKKQSKKQLNDYDFEIVGEKFLITSEEFEKICEKISNDKNIDDERKDQIRSIKIIGYQNELKTAVNRKTGQSLDKNLYVSSFIKPLVYYKDKNKEEVAFKAGFWALIDNKIDKEIETSIKLIKDQGLGGEISIGAGLFEEICFTEFEEEFCGNGFLNLSSYLPKEDEWKNSENWYYQIEKYYGWMFSYVDPEVIRKPKKSIYYILPGSVFNKQVKGKCINLGNEKNACWFNGKPILIKITPGDENEM